MMSNPLQNGIMAALKKSALNSLSLVMIYEKRCVETNHKWYPPSYWMGHKVSPITVRDICFYQMSVQKREEESLNE